MSATKKKTARPSGRTRTATRERSRNPGIMLSSTLDEVAQAAKVSTATVSRYFNAPHMLSPQTALRVREAVQQLGYVPNLMAGALATSRTRLVAAVIPAISQSIFASTIQALSDAMVEQGYSVLLGLTGLHDENAERQLLSIIGRRPDGIILTGTALGLDTRRLLKSAAISTIETWDLPRDPIDLVVGFSHEAVGRALAAHALDIGRRRALVVSASGVRARARSSGFSKAMLEHGTPEPVVAFYDGVARYRHGRSAVTDHLLAGGRPEIVVCSSDWHAHGALDALRAHGMRVPEDVAVVGFGDLDFASELDPSLTTVKIDGRLIGQQSAAFLLRRVQHQRIHEPVVDVGFTLIRRASS